ncbi:MAG: 50S ribosomal protein L5 [Lentisphaeraceae bacterium]|nr:50S ribosomal protein L5 [Lentisphaeraceae bacterium]
MVVSLKDTYKSEIVAEMTKRFGYKNVNMVPKLEKIVLNSGISTSRERDVLSEALTTLATITGQKALTTKARKSCAGFKIREDQPIGAKVTLRNSMMYDFLARLIHNALPRVRDFRGIKKGGFDGFGNYTMGVSDQSIFTELDLDKIKYQIGMNISFVTTAKSDEEGRALLELLGMPFEK